MSSPSVPRALPLPALPTLARTGRHVAAADVSAGLALLPAGGRHAAYGSTTEFCVNAGDAAQLLADASGHSVARLLADPTLVAEAGRVARAQVAEVRRGWDVRLGLTRAARERRDDADLQEQLVDCALDVLARTHAALGSARAS